jgi:choline kinase
MKKETSGRAILLKTVCLVYLTSYDSLTRKYTDKSHIQLAFEKLEKILHEHTSYIKTYRPSDKDLPHFPRRRTSSRKLKKATLLSQPSDTEFHEGEPVVPSTDVVLDNTRTVSQGVTKDKEGWLAFKNEIIRLTHTLRLKGWRRVGLDQGSEIEVKRLSGALTNAVYVVTPPKNLPQVPSAENGSAAYVPKRPPL